LQAAAERARGTIELRAGAAAEAASALESALSLWRRAHAPYEEAQARASLAEAHAARGDHDTAVLELSRPANDSSPSCPGKTIDSGGGPASRETHTGPTPP